MADAIAVHCPSCQTTFPVDPDKVPAGGVNARCSECADIFRVDVPVGESESTPLTVDEPATEPEPQDSFFSSKKGAAGSATAPPEEPMVEEPTTGDPVDEESSFGERGFDQSALEDPPAKPAPDESTEDEGTEGGPRPAFGHRSPEEKAQRLARVLVSDMITYNPKLYENAVSQGTLKVDFEEEIEKSWEEYVEQVGEEIANSTSHWTDALNEILAKGEETF